MNVATRLRLTLSLLLVTLVVVVALHVVTMRRTVQGTRALSALATRHQAATMHARRLDEMSASARKYGVTGDREYLERLATLARLLQEEIRTLELQSLTPGERGAFVHLSSRWIPVSRAIDSLVIDGRVSTNALQGREPAALPDGARRVAAGIDSIAGAMTRFTEASRLAMLDELENGDRRAVSIARVFWVIAVAAVLLAALLSTLLIRSIIGPLERLAHATREISRGQLGARLPAAGRDELALVTRDFNEMSARLEQLDRMKRDFISNVSHDLKSPLAAMQETNDALLDGLGGPVTERQRRLLEMSRDSGRRLGSMIHKLLDLSRLDSRASSVRELLDLSRLVERAADHMNTVRRAGSRRGPAVVYDRPSSHVLLRADAEEIAQVLDNLLENAVKFSPEHGTIRVAIEDADGVAVLRVSDDGPGVADEDKVRVFERFYQADAGRAAHDRGVGLGLAICRHVVEAHGGSIAVHDNTPHGAVFEVRIPGAITVGMPLESAPLAETVA